MGLSLPGNRLICLSQDNLQPESFERIIRPFAAWSHAEHNYQFDDSRHHQSYIINIEPKSGYPLSATFSRHGEQAKAQLKAMIERGDVICLNDVSVLPAGLFYIDDNGKLICRDENAFRFGGAKRIIESFNLAVSKRDYRRSGGKPAPTSSRQLRRGGSQPVTYDSSRETLNSKNVGRLLAAGGVYNGNVEGFRQTAEQLGGDAPAGYDQVMDNKGLIIAGASVAAGLGLGRLGVASELNDLHVLGKVEGEYSMIKPGPLPKELAETFSSGAYKEITLSTDTSFYRGGIEGRPLGQFFGYEQPQGVFQTRVDKALLPKWPNGSESPLDSYHEIQIPAGTKIYVGEVGYQTDRYSGGSEQVVVPTPWKIPGVKILGRGGVEMKNEIKKTVTDIINILSSNDEDSWAKTFEKPGFELDIDYESSIYSLKKLYGGMGSFNDIVLHKNGIPLIRENDELEDLRHKLYKQLEHAISLLKTGYLP